MTAPTTPSPERQPADAGGGLLPCPFCAGEAWLNDYEAKYSDLPPKSRCPQCRLCGASLGYLTTPAKAIAAWNRRAPAPQAQPDARAWLVQEFNHDGVLRSEFAVVGDQPWSGERGADQITTQPLYLSAPAADDGWRPISDYDGCGPVLVSTAPESPKYLFSEPVSAFHDAGGTWRCLGSKGGMAETALRPTHFRPLPAPPVALHPAAPTQSAAQTGEVDLPPISLDGPHKPDGNRLWLSRQLLDSRLTAEEAYSIVAYSPSIQDALSQPEQSQ